MYSHLKFTNDKGRESCFIQKWLNDKDIKLYDRTVFIPKAGEENERELNVYTGLCAEKYDDTVDTDISQLFDVMKTLVGDDDTHLEYLLKYLAHCVQKPYELPRVALIFKSVQGIGKGQVFGFFARKIIGYLYSTITSNINDLYGEFGEGLMDKIFVVHDEVKGKDTFGLSDRIKQDITDQIPRTFNIKYRRPIRRTPYARFIFLTNIEGTRSTLLIWQDYCLWTAQLRHSIST